MKLFMIDHEEHGVWYFTSKSRAAKYLETSPVYIDYCIKLGKTCKGWKIEEIESGDILSRYINPERKYV